MNKNYEVMFIIKTMEEEATEAIINRVEKLITTNGGTMNNIDRWGKKRLAYEINKEIEGYYVVMQFAIEPKQIAEIDRVIKINENIMRHLIVKEGE